jgi:polar amino acid transport system substrate-binding protein
MVLELDNPLTACVDQAITTLTENGELEAITQEWLSDFTGAPVITAE